MLRLTLGRLLGAAACGCVCALAEPGCASDPPERTARSSSAITQGSADTGDGAVVALVAASGVTACTGTLVAPHMVLTAGHCTLAQVVEGASVVFGSSLNDPVATLPVTQAVTHPQFDPTTLANDVGILILASDAPVAPVPLGTGAPDVGATLDLVGWGLTAADAGDTGQKRQGTSAVTQVDATTFAVAAIPSQPCEGDSGGPALVTANGSHPSWASPVMAMPRARRVRRTRASMLSSHRSSSPRWRRSPTRGPTAPHAPATPTASRASARRPESALCDAIRRARRAPPGRRARTRLPSTISASRPLRRRRAGGVRSARAVDRRHSEGSPRWLRCSCAGRAAGVGVGAGVGGGHGREGGRAPDGCRRPRSAWAMAQRSASRASTAATRSRCGTRAPCSSGPSLRSSCPRRPWS